MGLCEICSINSPSSFFLKKAKVHVSFAGAKSGSSGGATVKVLRLKKFNDNINFNIVYSLSNSVF